MIENYDNKVNELNMDDVIFHGINKEDFLFIDWNLLYGCNYKCSYCFGQETLNDTYIPNIDNLKYAVDQIFKINKKTYIFNILGGEPTFYPNLIDLVSYIDSFNKNTILCFITNGSKSIEYFETLISSFNCECIFTISIHLEYADIEHIEKLIILFNKYQKLISFALMAHPELKEKTFNFFNRLLELRNKYIFDLRIAELKAPPTFEKIDDRYDDDFNKWIDYNRNNYDFNSSNYKQYDKKTGLRFPLSHHSIYKIKNENVEKNIQITHALALRNMKRTFKDFYCCAGINLLSIDPFGNYRGAICSVVPFIGNLHNEEIDIYKLTKYYKCSLEQCGCNTNDCNHKYRYQEDADKYINDYILQNSNSIIRQLNNKLNFNNTQISDLNNKILKLNEELVNNKEIVKSIINSLAWWIPVKKWRDNFRCKFKIEDQTRPDQTRPDQTRP